MGSRPAPARLGPADRARAAQISLLALSRQVDYVISVTGWLGVAGKGGDTVEDLKKIDPRLLQCAHGTEEDEDPCPTLKANGVEVLPVDGGTISTATMRRSQTRSLPG